jgi:hypothetical protein
LNFIWMKGRLQLNRWSKTIYAVRFSFHYVHSEIKVFDWTDAEGYALKFRNLWFYIFKTLENICHRRQTSMHVWCVISTASLNYMFQGNTQQFLCCILFIGRVLFLTWLG